MIKMYKGGGEQQCTHKQHLSSEGRQKAGEEIMGFMEAMKKQR